MKERLSVREALRRPSSWMLLGILALSFFMNFWNIGQNGTCNAYYAACIKSMTQNWHNFFYVSFDPAGMVSVDKPPLGLWMQALSCLIFGYSGWAMLLPNAVAGTLSCLLIYRLVNKYFSKPAGLVSAFLFALTPAVVLVARNSTMDMQLIFWLLLAAWFLMKAIDTGKWRWLIVCGLLVGVGFNVKMLQAYLIVPAVVVTYLIFSKEKFRKRLLAGVLAAAVMVGVSFAWIAAVDLTPASQRPYVDSTSNNSALELVFGHNGVERLTGSTGGGGGKSGAMPSGGQPNVNGSKSAASAAAGTSSTAAKAAGTTTITASASSAATTKVTAASSSSSTKTSSGTASATQKADATTSATKSSGSTSQQHGMMQGGQQGSGRSGSMSDIGTASPVRLWSNSLYGQASWLLLFAVASLVLSLRKKALKAKDPQQRSLVFWGMWLLTTGAFFSFAGFFHQYYLCMIAAPVAVLSGIGLTALYRFLKNYKAKQTESTAAVAEAVQVSTDTVENTAVPAETAQPAAASKAKLSFDVLRPWLLLTAFFANILFSFVYVLNYSSVSSWLAPLILIPCIVGAVLLTIYLLRSTKQVMLRAAAGLLAVALMAGSAYWAWTPVQTAPNATIPVAGPNSTGGQGGGQMPNMNGGSTQSGSTQNGTAQNGGGQMPGNGQMPNMNGNSTQSGSTQNGTAQNGNGQMPNMNGSSTQSGSTQNGTAQNGSGQMPGNGQMPNMNGGSTQSGSTQNGTVQNGGGQMPGSGQMPNMNGNSTQSGSTQNGTAQNGGGQMPSMGSTSSAGKGSGAASANTALETYLKKNYKQGSFLLTACRSDTVAQYIIDTGLPCYAYGGFLGSDNSLTLTKLKQLVAQGKITYFLVSNEGGGNSNSDILSYVEKNATKIDASTYGGSSSGGGQSGGTLYLFKTSTSSK